MKQTKPIFIVELPLILPSKEVVRINEVLNERMKDYHVIVFHGQSKKPIFQCFYEKDFNEVKFEELKKIIK